jgi:hypothetical protein
MNREALEFQMNMKPVGTLELTIASATHSPECPHIVSRTKMAARSVHNRVMARWCRKSLIESLLSRDVRTPGIARVIKRYGMRLTNCLVIPSAMECIVHARYLDEITEYRPSGGKQRMQHE